jgi:MFS family permease
VGLNGLFRAAPSFGFGFFGGAFADRYERKRIVLATTFAQVVLSAALAVLAFTGNLAAWSIYLITALNATVQAVGSPAQSAMLPSLIPRSALANAVAMNSILFRGSALIGPALGGIIIATWGIGGAYTANSLFHLAVVFTLPFIRATSVGSAGGTQLVRSIVEGLNYVRRQPVICGALLLEAFASFFSLNQVFLTIFAKDILQVGASGFGLMQSARGVGSIAGALALIFMGNFRHPGKTLYVLGTIHVLTYLLFAYSRVWPFSLLLLLILGMSDTMWGTTRNVIFQYSSVEGMRGRVMSISQMTFRGLNHLGQAPTGVFIDLLGGRLAVFSAGLVIGGSLLWTNYLYPGLKRFILEEKGPEQRQSAEASVKQPDA